MTDLPPRLFATDADVHRIGVGLLDRTLPRADWTHEAYLAACLWIMRERRDIDVGIEIRTIISRYNEAVGGVNDDAQGYHDTITHCFARGVAAHLRECPTDLGLADAVNALLVSPRGKRDWPLNFYTRDRLFSVAARRDFIPPDLAALPDL